MVVGIFGPQSSGKSTLLNFLFGCDFQSSDGRCTNGVYGTYYEINNLNINNCSGILLLDTEGLFSNYQNKRCKNRQNFDNKLILFLLKTCDVLIMNTRGDVDKNCQNILELAFDCDLMEPKKGSRYPNFYMVLNQSAGKINHQQQLEVQSLRSKILDVAPHMSDYISTIQSNSMPQAFNTNIQQSNSKILKELQLRSQIPTE
jgi:GTPase Era involved in 16S rRNA processing